MTKCRSSPGISAWVYHKSVSVLPQQLEEWCLILLHSFVRFTLISSSQWSLNDLATVIVRICVGHYNLSFISLKAFMLVGSRPWGRIQTVIRCRLLVLWPTLSFRERFLLNDPCSMLTFTCFKTMEDRGGSFLIRLRCCLLTSLPVRHWHLEEELDLFLHLLRAHQKMSPLKIVLHSFGTMPQNHLLHLLSCPYSYKAMIDGE